MSDRFPDGFLWGSATASAQVEGAASADGKSPSIWDHFARQPGKVRNGDTPDVACDQYHRFESDADLMASLGLKHHRFSIAWPRVIPDGRGPINPLGLDHYDRLVDALLTRGITPWPTLFHWDLPQALEEKGGWLVRSTVDAFATYAEAVVKRLGDRVRHWFSVNEIPCFIGHGYGTGIFAPGHKVDPKRLNQAYHHALLAHGHAVSAVRNHGSPGSQVGLVHNHLPP
ncbi:MAG TPA: family 1 glycosylhydrolase, partial [Isosphaeraceae bacterium]|nr:family 1 glycosylhydrolase [Isosphaeraceae bacterium]